MGSDDKQRRQEPAEGVLKNSSLSPHLDQYTVQCNCSDPTHSHSVMVDAEDAEGFISVFVAVTSAPDGFLDRLKEVFKILTTGLIRKEVELLMTPQQSRNYAYVMETAADKIEQKDSRNAR